MSSRQVRAPVAHSTRAQPAQAQVIAPTQTQGQTLCDFCHKKPQYGTHPYCSKTCAAQATSYCNHCHKKPKHGNFDFCGKTCASLGNNKPPAPLGNSRVPNTKLPAGSTAGNAAFQALGQIASMAVNGKGPAAGLVSKLPKPMTAVAQQALNAFIPNVPSGQQQTAPIQSFTASTYTVTPNQASYASNATTNSKAPSFPNQPYTNVNANGTTKVRHVQAAPAECLIPGCGQPVHVDPNGVQESEYCSQSHREEAVTTGLISPCIMCLTMPQCETDYFCGRQCRNEALCRGEDS